LAKELMVKPVNILKERRRNYKYPPYKKIIADHNFILKETYDKDLARIVCYIYVCSVCESILSCGISLHLNHICIWR